MADHYMITWILAKVTKKPGISTKWLFENRPRIGKEEMVAADFHECLLKVIIAGMRTANGLWWPAGHIGAPREPKPPRAKPHPKQLPLFSMEKK